MTDQLITTESELHELIQHLQEQDWFAVDTEFERERTYYPRLCLLQVATSEQVACIDPLAVQNLNPLRALMCETSAIKVFHSCSQDLEVLYQLWDAVPSPIFDTQVGATVLGLTDQMGYAALVKQRLAVELPKAHTRTPWCRRPLSDMELRYAGDDVRYLAALYPQLRDDLASVGRLDWLDDEFAALCDPAGYENPPAEAWRRVGGLDRLTDDQLAAAQSLAEWRETQAQTRDLPRAWVLRDNVLRDLASGLPDNVRDLGNFDLPGKLIKRHGPAIIELLAAARASGPRERPRREHPLSNAESAQVTALRESIASRAEELSLDATLLASKKRLVKIVRGASFDETFAGWRRHALRDCFSEG